MNIEDYREYCLLQKEMIRDFIAIDFETANQQPADNLVIRCPITNSTPLQPPVAMISKTITTHWPMPKPAQQ